MLDNLGGWLVQDFNRWQWQLKHPWDTRRCVFWHGAWHARNTVTQRQWLVARKTGGYTTKRVPKKHPWRLYLRTGWVSNGEYRPPKKNSAIGSFCKSYSTGRKNLMHWWFEMRWIPIDALWNRRGTQNPRSKHNTLPKFNSSPLKNGGTGRLSFLLGFGKFSGANC